MLAAVALDDLIAIHHRPSGATHLVEPLVPELLDALGDDWCDAPALLERLAARFDLPDADAAALTARLDELAEAGLVEAR
jgi:PqqD family protein of HPr-rel-A system